MHAEAHGLRCKWCDSFQQIQIGWFVKHEMDIPRKIVSLLGLFGAVTYEYKVSV